MAEATSSLQHDALRRKQAIAVERLPITFETRLRHAILWQARQAARAEVVRQLKARGVKVAAEAVC